jgi:hypothetical protein
MEVGGIMFYLPFQYGNVVSVHFIMEEKFAGRSFNSKGKESSRGDPHFLTAVSIQKESFGMIQ